ncbi:uncharacterized protein EV420DRAFT_1750718 [Desarmillaria tabescens]|uniref:Uncharacterized protein n=1 Tax=Armillaria tabescens TaxID=1929756 RepID=A0AA39MXP5_ARMTA|nr:uncharacterized protein EV420DRAFT_1750718 [Desarmillaria tabescens]KAK0449690.1 hypothetical protein EV420DRAFT_1750718 [Desarmillaria tabescens]
MKAPPYVCSLALALIFASPALAAPTVRYEVPQSPYLTRFVESDSRGGMSRYIKRIPESLRRERGPSYSSVFKRPEEDVFHARALEDTVFISVRRIDEPGHDGMQFIIGNQILEIAESPRTMTGRAAFEVVYNREGDDDRGGARATWGGYDPPSRADESKWLEANVDRSVG